MTSGKAYALQGCGDFDKAPQAMDKLLAWKRVKGRRGDPWIEL